MISITDLSTPTQFDPIMAQLIISEEQVERERDRAYYQQIISDQSNEIEELKEQIADLLAEKSKMLLSNTRMADRLYLYDLQRSTEKKVNANPTLDSGSKIVATEIIRTITNEHDDPHTPMVIIQEDIAEKCGVSSATVTRVKKKIAQAGGWVAQTSKPELLENGKWKTETTFMLENIIDRPDLVLFEKHAGGARLRQRDGEALDTISIDYSRSQETAFVRMLPGQRADLDPAKIIQAIKEDRCILDKYTHNRAEKLADSTDALKNRIDQALTILDDPAEYAPGTTLRDVVDQQDEAIASTQVQPEKQDEKQDAFIMPAQPKQLCRRCERNAWLWNEKTQQWTCRACFVAANPQAPTYFYDQDRMQEALDNLVCTASQQVDPSPWVLDIMTDQGWDHYIMLAQ